MRIVYIVLASYWTVLVAELIGDKAIYTVASLTLRFRARFVFTGIATAFAGKMLVAVLLGKLLLQMPPHWSAALSAVAFFGAATFIWFKQSEAISEQDPVARTWWRVTSVAFASLFFTEWGDPGQIAAAAMTLQFQLPAATWLGGTLAMTTKAVFAMILGVKLKDRLPQKGLRSVATASCYVLGLLALYDTVF